MALSLHVANPSIRLQTNCHLAPASTYPFAEFDLVFEKEGSSLRLEYPDVTALRTLLEEGDIAFKEVESGFVIDPQHEGIIDTLHCSLNFPQVLHRLYVLSRLQFLFNTLHQCARETTTSISSKREN